MPFVETVNDLVEALADLVGVYGAHDDVEAKTCRVCWTSAMAARIHGAVANEAMLAVVPPHAALAAPPRAEEE